MKVYQPSDARQYILSLIERAIKQAKQGNKLFERLVALRKEITELIYSDDVFVEFALAWEKAVPDGKFDFLNESNWQYEGQIEVEPICDADSPDFARIANHINQIWGRLVNEIAVYQNEDSEIDGHKFVQRMTKMVY
jgi:hypothetical protein